MKSEASLKRILTITSKGKWFIGTSLGFIAFAWLLYTVRGILLPFIIGGILAYALNPMVSKISRLGLGRGIATFVVSISFFVFIGLFCYYMIPLMFKELIDLLKYLPTPQKISEDIKILIENVTSSLDKKVIDEIQSGVRANIETFVRWGKGLFLYLFNETIAWIYTLIMVIISPIVTIYLLRDWDRVIRIGGSYFPPRYENKFKTQFYLIDRALAGFARGQALVCLSLAAYYGVGLWAIGVKSGFTVGALAGLLAFVPFIGSITGCFISIIVTVANPGVNETHIMLELTNQQLVLAILGIFAIGQVLEGKVLIPKLIGNKINLHPVWVIFALLAGSKLYGFVGMLIAVPMAAIIAVIVRFVIQEYLKSPIYHGEEFPNKPAKKPAKAKKS